MSMKIQITHDEGGRLKPLRRCAVFDNEPESRFDAIAPDTEDESEWKTVFLEAQVNSCADGILIADIHGRKLLQNQKLVDLFNIPREIADDADDERQLGWVIEAIKNGEQFIEKVTHLYSHPFETSCNEIELKNGTVLEWHSSPAVGKDGTLYGRISVYRDITERKRIEATLFQSQKMELAGRLAGGVAHEFNNLMTRVIGQVGLMQEDLPPAHALFKNVTEIHQAATRAAVLSHQLLGFARKQIADPDVIDLNAVLAGMEEAVRVLAGRKVGVHFPSLLGPKVVRADAAQIEQVVLSVVMNATEAMPHGGELAIETGETVLDEDYTRRFGGLKPGEYVLLAVTDTGPGMSQTVKARLFEPFFTTKAAGKGAGLGLATCHRIIEQIGGHIAVYSDCGWGTSVRIYLPKAAAKGDVRPTVARKAELPVGVETILLVEDNQALLKIASMLLRGLGYSILAAGSGVEALEAATQKAKGDIDLVLTNVVMRDMGGKELSDRIHSLCPGARILFSSDWKESAVVPQDILHHGAGLLRKPYTPSMLANKVREALDRGCEPVNGHENSR
jgi:signal transduction histidine kinase